MKALSPSDRVRLVCIALQGTRYVNPRGEVPGDRAFFVHLFCDHLKLLYQQPLFVSIWLHREGMAPAFFTTLRNQDRLFFGRPSMGSGGITPEQEQHPEWPPIRVRAAGLEGTILTVVIAPLPLRDLRIEPDSLPAWEQVEEFIREFGRPLAESMAEYGFEPASDLVPKEKQEAAPTSERRDDIDDLYSPLRTQLGRVFRQFRRTQGLHVASDDAEAGAINLFAVVRYRDGELVRTVHSPASGVASNFLYTARILLTEDQATWIRKVVGSDCQDATSLMQAPLDVASRSIADSVFASGTIDFGLPAEWNALGSRSQSGGVTFSEDLRRKVVESQVYERITSGCRHSIFYVPIHVGGSPWLALFSFQAEQTGEDEDNWRRRFHLYSAAVPVLTQQLREAAAHAYAECLASTLERSLIGRNEAAAVGLINRQWTDAASVYPFARYELVSCSAADPDDVLSLANRHWALHKCDPDNVWRDHAGANDQFRPQVRVVDGSEQVVRSEIFAAIARYRAHEDNTMSRAAGAYMTLSHELNNLMGKEFPNVLSTIARSVRATEDRDYLEFAWSAVRGVAEIGYRSCKARHADPSRREELVNQLLEPLRRMHREGTLLDCLHIVAARVYRSLRLDRQGLVVPELENAPERPISDGEDFSTCYLLTAEPVRNLRHTYNGTAHWKAECSESAGLRIHVTQPGRQTSMGPPVSQTFSMLADFLSVFDATAKQEFDDVTKATTWVIEVPARRLGGRI